MNRSVESERLAKLVFYGTVLLIGYLGWRIVQPFLPEIVWAAVLAICLAPVRGRLEPRLGRNKTAAVLSATVLLLIVVPVVFIGITLVKEAGPAVEYVDKQLRNQGGPAGSFHVAWEWLRVRAPFLPEEQDVIARVSASIGNVAQFVAGQATGLVVGVGGLLFALVITTAVLFFLLRDADTFAGHVRRLLPFGPEQNERLTRIAYDLVSASVTATLAIAGVQGLIGGAAFALLGIPGAVLWGVMMALLAFLPAVGSALVWAPAAVWLALSGSLTKGIILAAVGLGIMGQVDNVVRPLLLSGKSKMSTLVLVMSLLGGVSAFGFIGIVLGPLVAALLTALFETSLDPAAETPVAGAPPAVAERDRDDATDGAADGDA